MNLTDVSMLQQRKAEQLFAGAALINPGLALERCAWLSEDVILDERVRRFWHNLTGQYRGDPIASAMEATALTDITTWSTEVMSSFDCESYAREIQRRAFLRHSDPLIGQLVSARQANDVPAFRNAVMQLYQMTPTSDSGGFTPADLHEMFVKAIENETIGFKTAIPNLDKLLGGFELGLNYILASRPSMGKSTLAFQIARNVAKDGKTVIYFSLEMSAMQLWAKAACGALGLSWRDVREKKVMPDTLEQVYQKSSELIEQYEDRLIIDDRVTHTTESLWQIVAARKPSLVVVDVMARLKDRQESEVKRLGSIAYTLREMGKENNCATLVLHHINREAEHQDRKQPSMSNLRDSGEIEQAADTIILLHSEDYYDMTKNVERYLRTDAIIAKNRDGARNMVAQLLYDTKEQWFRPANP